MDALTLIIELIFGILFVATLGSYLRRRDPLSRDVMLIFASLAGLFVVAGIAALGVTLPDPVGAAALGLLLAQPVLTLRLAHRLRPISRVVLVTATVLWAAPSLLMIVVPLRTAPVLILFAIGVFVLTNLAATVYLVREARRRVGSARIRLDAAAAASGLMALALGVSIVLPVALGAGAADVGRMVALLAAGLYAVAFLPPGWARRIGNAFTTFEFTEHLLGDSSGDGAEAVWTRLAELARRTTGSAATLVALGEPPVVVACAAGDNESAGVAMSGVRLTAAVSGDRGELADLAGTIGAEHVSVLPLDLADGEAGALVVFRERPSLFAADDESILSSLIGHARVFAERSEAMKEEAALAKRLSATVQALEQASQAKSDFLASMSHELRTPLSTIIGFSALMREEPLVDGKRSVPDEWIDHMRRSGDHLLALINDVLDLTKIEAGRIDLTLEPFDLGAALAESVEGLRPLADRKGIAMLLDAHAGTIRADRGRLRQIVYNLLSNAIKFTPDGGRVTVEASWHGAEARVAVTDTGVGIATDDLPHIFEEFSQVGDMKARESGTGLGLALSRRLAEAHGGEIIVASAPGTGSRFEVRLPDSRVVEAEAVEVAQLARATSDPQASTILVIEDDPSAVRLLRTYLETEGYQVEVATDGESGIAAARAHPPSAIILDVLLPGIDGWEVLRRLKGDPDLRDVPVMVATVVDERTVAMNLGAVDYFLKPVRPDALLARLATYTFTTKVKQRNIRVLVIDDELSARELVAGALRPEGFEVVTAASGDEGLALARERPPDLVICDLVMPDMDGFEVVNRLADADMPKDVPILILTGHELTSADRGRLNGKVADIMQKDGDPRPALGRWLQRAAAASGRRSTAAAA